MNRASADARWKALRGHIKDAWNDLSDEDLDRFEGRREQFVGHIQERYGLPRADVEQRLDQFDRAEGAQWSWGGTSIH